MKQEDKELLLKDLCARLPYGVMVSVNNDIKPLPLKGITFEKESKLFNCPSRYACEVGGGEWSHICIKPYLRPMSSMTEEERNELSHYDNSVQRTDFFYFHHIDCRYMIEKRLALEAPKDMYSIK